MYPMTEDEILMKACSLLCEPDPEKYTDEETVIQWVIDKMKEDAGINAIAKQIHQNNRDKGFYDNERSVAETLCLIHSEVSEALECDRKDKHCINDHAVSWALSTNDEFHLYQEYFPEFIKDTFEDELADIMIRVMDLAAHKGIDLEGHIRAKVRYNTLRPYKHGKKY